MRARWMTKTTPIVTIAIGILSIVHFSAAPQGGGRTKKKNTPQLVIIAWHLRSVSPSRASTRLSLSYLAVFTFAALLLASATHAVPESHPLLVETDPDIVSRPQLSLVWSDHYRLLPRSFRSMTREVERIFEDIGVPVLCTDGTRSVVHEELESNALQVIVVLHPRKASALGFGGEVLGLAGSGKIRTVYIFFPGVVETLGFHHGTNTLEKPWNQAKLARALGLVVVHEVVHLLAPDLPHSSEGLMSQRLTRRYLLNGGVHLDPVTAEALQRRLGRTGRIERAGWHDGGSTGAQPSPSASSSPERK